MKSDDTFSVDAESLSQRMYSKYVYIGNLLSILRRIIAFDNVRETVCYTDAMKSVQIRCSRHIRWLFSTPLF